MTCCCAELKDSTLMSLIVMTILRHDSNFPNHLKTHTFNKHYALQAISHSGEKNKILHQSIWEDFRKVCYKQKTSCKNGPTNVLQLPRGQEKPQLHLWCSRSILEELKLFIIQRSDFSALIQTCLFFFSWESTYRMPQKAQLDLKNTSL